MDIPGTPVKLRAFPLSSGQPVKDTPAKIHATLSHTYLSSGLDAMRGEIVSDINHCVPMIDFDSFSKFILPPLKKGINVQDVISSLKDSGLIIPVKSDITSWKYFQVTPAKHIDNEDTVFFPLEELCRKATSFARQISGREHTFVLRLLPNIAPSSERESKTRPDCYFIRRNAEEKASRARNQDNKVRYWYDIALTGEFKKRMSEVELIQNRRQVIFNMQQTMTLDPSRRFTFGISIEDTTMRLWFVSRSTPVVSEGFDFREEPDRLVHVFLSFAFASDVEMGWDPTITPFITRSGGRQYKILIGKQLFVTEVVLSDCAADALVSRGTRVWKVRRYNSPSKDRFVIKDYWVDDSRYSDTELLLEILDAIEVKYGRNVREEVAFHVLTPIDDWYVPVNGKEDHTTRIMMRGYSRSFEFTLNLKAETKKGNPSKRSVGPSAASDLETTSVPTFCRTPPGKRHHRVVFKEGAIPLFGVENLSDAFVVLRDIAKVLKWLHGAGYVHRDIGLGNLYFFDGRGLIGDFEYAKQKFSDGTHDIRSCSTDCMACEAIIGHYKVPRKALITRFRQALNSALDIDRKVVHKEPVKGMPFYHNDLHDLESLWWAAIWQLFFKHSMTDEIRDNGVWSEIFRKRANDAIDLFPRNHTVQFRMTFFEDQEAYDDVLLWIPPTLEEIKYLLNNLRLYLNEAYERFESHLPEIEENEFNGAQDMARDTFEHCRIDVDGHVLIPPGKTNPLRQSPESQSNEDQEGREQTDKPFENTQLGKSQVDVVSENKLAEDLEKLDLKDHLKASNESDEEEEIKEVEEQLLVLRGDEDGTDKTDQQGYEDDDGLTPMPLVRMSYGNKEFGLPE